MNAITSLETVLSGIRLATAAAAHLGPILQQFQQTQTAMTSDQQAEVDAALAELHAGYDALRLENQAQRPAV